MYQPNLFHIKKQTKVYIAFSQKQSYKKWVESVIVSGSVISVPYCAAGFASVTLFYNNYSDSVPC